MPGMNALAYFAATSAAEIEEKVLWDQHLDLNLILLPLRPQVCLELGHHGAPDVVDQVSSRTLKRKKNKNVKRRRFTHKHRGRVFSRERPFYE